MQARVLQLRRPKRNSRRTSKPKKKSKSLDGRLPCPMLRSPSQRRTTLRRVSMVMRLRKSGMSA